MSAVGIGLLPAISEGGGEAPPTENALLLEEDAGELLLVGGQGPLLLVE